MKANLSKHPMPGRHIERFVTRHYCEREQYMIKQAPYADRKWNKAQAKLNDWEAKQARCKDVCETCKRYAPSYVWHGLGKHNYPVPALYSTPLHDYGRDNISLLGLVVYFTWGNIFWTQT